MKLLVQYFAQLSETAGTDAETIESASADLAEIYAALQARHGFGFPQSALKPVCNNALVGWAHALQDNDVIAFLPPFSGG
jgi:molybdopterin synthase sulfur carrier subunit